MRRFHTQRTGPCAAVFVVGAIAAGCGAAGQGEREGDVKDLLSPRDGKEVVPLASRALAVEQVATALEPQVDEYRIGRNDVLNISVVGHDEVSSARDFNRGIVGTIVKKDGNIYVPVVGAVKAAGYTVEEFQKVFTAALSGYIKDPQLTVDVLKYESQKFFVLGQVDKPGAFPVNGSTTLLEGIGMAGGVLETGNLARAYVVRGKGVLPIDLEDLVVRGDTSRNVYMRGGDLVYVPPASDQTVYVLGEVPHPGAVPIKSQRLPLAEALAQAGGILPAEADDDSIKLIRGSWQEPTVYTLDYDTVLRDGDRIFLEPGDRLIVQPTNLTVMSRYMQQILPFLIGADTAGSIYQRVAAP
ncbi:MAG: polysaccharide biosynthesis/export family protein [Deltaproteobacteria bacterium]|nr:polysaccharide biosynthesis/export family protein [Deltaproteobacteria bacterium]